MAREGRQGIRLTDEVSCDTKEVLGVGRVACVFPGMKGNSRVAIKRIQNEYFNKLEESCMQALDHPNVLKCFGLIEQQHFTYIVLEFCEATVENYCRGEYRGKVPCDRAALFQMADGLDHLHSKSYAHRDISSNNVLIKLTGDKAVMKISDFGVCKPASETKSFSMSGDGIKGTIPFLAPELLRQMLSVENQQETNKSQSRVRGHISNDIFSLGCVFYRFLTKDGHPFIEGAVNFDSKTISLIELNILNNNQFLERLSAEQAFAKALIERMIQPDKDERPQMNKVKQELNSHLNS